MKEQIIDLLGQLLVFANKTETTKFEIRSKIANLLIWLESQ